MKAPTNVTGPDGTVVRRGEDIPDAWFEELPDLADHLDAITAPEPAEETSDGVIRASATIGRERASK